jgi:protein-disulfide isomerase
MNTRFILLALLAAGCSNAASEVAPAPRAEVAPASVEPRYRIPVDHLPSIGNEDALVTVVVFTDYECPYCAKTEAALADLKRRLGDELRIVVAHTPLSFHERARPAALAALAAAAQNRFEIVHHRLFALEGKLDDASLVAVARNAGLDQTRFEADRAGPAAAKALAEAEQVASRFSVKATPTVFINGVHLQGANVEAMNRIVDEQLAAARGLVKQGVPKAQVYQTVLAGGLESGPLPTGDDPLPVHLKVIRAHRAEVDQCWQQHREGEPRVELALVVKTDGTLERAEATPPSPLASCIQNAAAKWAFKPSAHQLQMKLPYEFTK